GPQPYQVFRVELLSGEYVGSVFTIDYGLRQIRPQGTRLEAGDRIMVTATASPDGEVQVYFADFVRTGAIGWWAAAFAVLIVVVSRGKGLRALAGMAVSLLLILGFILPQILAGADPVLIGIVGSFALLTATFYLIHGWTLKSHTAVVATLGALLITGALASLSVTSVRLTGYGSEEALFLTQLAGRELNVRGLLLAGILVGALGVLDDLTINQVSAVFELRRANPGLSLASLYRRAMVIGQDHIAATVNTLLLAYVGASLPLLLLFSVFQEPALAIVNREVIAEEIVRTLVGSLGLMAAVPLATVLASAVAANRHRLAAWLGPDTAEAEVV
ncbi:MAG TPA: YibE/F family protein, partial [Anaerolineales bacterium]|nr:YibE/F family protein [Anaerolineales bacterium]